MGTARFLDTKDDLEALGLIDGVVQQREDGRVVAQGRAGSEVWYFDATLEDGTKVTAGFRTKPIQNCESLVDDPVMVVSITTPDGVTHADTARYAPDEAVFDTGHCDVTCGPHSVSGDLVDYRLHVEPIERKGESGAATDGMARTSVKGTGVDLLFRALVEPFRHGAGRTVFNGDPDLFSSWFSIPKMDVAGTITIEGEAREVIGVGYHDHRCMAIDDMIAWHHWIWGRQHFDDYTIVLFDLVTAEQFGLVRVPLFCIYDKAGRIIFDNDGDVDCRVIDRYWNEATRKHYPTSLVYTFHDGSKTVEYTLSWTEEMEARDMYWSFPQQARAVYDRAGQRPSYMRYTALGEMFMRSEYGTIRREGSLIYELAYCGKEIPEGQI